MTDSNQNSRVIELKGYRFDFAVGHEINEEVCTIESEVNLSEFADTNSGMVNIRIAVTQQRNKMCVYEIAAAGTYSLNEETEVGSFDILCMVKELDGFKMRRFGLKEGDADGYDGLGGMAYYLNEQVVQMFRDMVS